MHFPNTLRYDLSHFQWYLKITETRKDVGKNPWKIVSVYSLTSNEFSFLWNKLFPEIFNPLSPNPTKWSKTLILFVGNRSDELFECVWPFCGVGAYRVRIADAFHIIWIKNPEDKNCSLLATAATTHPPSLTDGFLELSLLEMNQLPCPSKFLLTVRQKLTKIFYLKFFFLFNKDLLFQVNSTHRAMFVGFVQESFIWILKNHLPTA